MATSRRHPRPEADSEALRAKLATMTYSFAQQLPQLSSHTPPPPPHNPQQTPADDPNFPKLTSKPLYNQTARPGHPPSRAWDAAKRPPTPNRPPRWANGPGKPTTAAEVVASVPSDTSVHSEEAAETEKEEAELALYSKLVPTTSAVPRNPGSSLGSGGLRATGSVAAQKSSRTSTTTPLHAPQALPSIVRKEPMVSRMQSLSSDASKPQLARRVAKLNRSASATPPPALSVPSSASSSASVDGMETETTFDEELEKAGAVPFTSVLRKEDFSRPRYGIREDSPPRIRQILYPGTLRGQTESYDTKTLSNPARRFEEAFFNRRRNDMVTVTGIVNGRKSSMPTLRRSSAMLSSQEPRGGSGKDTSENDVTRSGKEVSDSSIPPGFEGRSATGSRSAYVRPRNGRSDADSPMPARSFDRGNPPIRPQNARADALREALDSRRRSGSPRTVRHSRTASGDSTSRPNGLESSVPRSNGTRNRSERDNRRAVTTEPDFIRRAQNSSSHRTDSRMNSSGPPDSKRSGSLGRNGEFVNRSRTTSSAGHRTRNESQLPSTGFRAEPAQGSKPYSPSRHPEIDLKESSAISIEPLRPNMYTTHHESGRLHNGRSEMSLGSSPPLQSQLPTGRQNGRSNHAYPPEQNGEWRGSLSKTDGNGIGRQDVTSNSYHNRVSNTSKSAHGSVFAANSQHTCSSTSAMMETVRGLLGTNGDATGRTHFEGMDDVVLPPLPNSEDVAFESMLRSMGWTPLDEDEGPKHHQTQANMNGLRNETNGSYHNGVQRRMNGIDNANGSNVGNGFYSHFH